MIPTNVDLNEIRKILFDRIDVTDDGDINALTMEHAAVQIVDYVNMLEANHLRLMKEFKGGED